MTSPTVSDSHLDVNLIADETKIYVAVHADDFGIAASNTVLKEETMSAIKEINNYTESDLGFCLWMQLVRDWV